ncbi:MAG: CHAD domain-containing protein [Spirochaetales bacterium]|nr:CHAD domain-containing protein [Spirochaetales bacterium]
MPAEAFRKKYYEGWKLLDLGTLHLDTTEYMCRNDAGKGIARLWLVSLRAKTLVQLLYFVPLLGYEQEARSLYRFLKNGAGLSPASANRHPFHAALGLRLFTKSDHAVDLDKATTAILGTRLRFYARSAFLQIDGILRDVDPECLHQFRVELRKMRSLIVLFKSFLTSYHAELKLVLDELMTRTNRLRDLDVLLISCHDCVRSIGNKKAYHALMERLSNERNNEQALVASWLHSDSCKRDIHRAIQLLKKRSPVWRRSGRDVAMATALAERIARAYANVQTTTLAMNPEATSAEIHRLRIIHKRLRYLLDFSQDLKPCQATMALLNTMKTSQKHLGNFNDTVIQLDWLKSWEEEHADTLTAPEKEALVTIVQLMETRAHEQRSSAIGHAGESVGSGAEELVQAIVQQRGSP